MDYPSVLGTQNVMMAATLAKGTTVIINAAAEPEIVGLAEMLNKMGARIHGAGGHTVEIEGVETLHGARHAIIPDRIEAGTFAIAAAISGGDVRICRGSASAPALAGGQAAGGRRPGGRGRGQSCSVCCPSELRAVSIQARALSRPAHRPPGAHGRSCSPRRRGVSYVHERVFDNRLLYVSELRKMGAEVVSTGTTAIISGPTPLIGTSVRALDIRAGAALLLAALAARGRTEISDIYHLNRGYQRIDEKLRSVGAVIHAE